MSDYCEQCKWLKYRPSGEYEDCKKCIYAAGRADAVRECVEAVKEMVDDYDTGSDLHCECRRMIGRVLAALWEVEDK